MELNELSADDLCRIILSVRIADLLAARWALAGSDWASLDEGEGKLLAQYLDALPDVPIIPATQNKATHMASVVSGLARARRFNLAMGGIVDEDSEHDPGDAGQRDDFVGQLAEILAAKLPDEDDENG